MSAAKTTAQNAGAANRADPGRLRVGVSIFVRKGEQSLWENGIYQNCLFLVMLLVKAPNVAETYLVSGGGDGDTADAQRFMADSPVPIIDMAAAAEKLDVMIEMSAQLNREWAVSFRERGGKIVTMRVGNDYVIDIERMIFDKPHGLLIAGTPYDEIWTLPEYERSCMHYFGTAMRAPVRLMQHLWSPAVIDRAAATLANGESFGYKPGRKKWRLGIFEPNICMVKTSHLPMLLVDMAHRANPRVIELLRVYNTFHMKDHVTFVGFANSLDIVRHGLATFEGRFPVYQCLSSQIDAVVCHQWENGQNYLYYEALHGGYPLIHNSTFIGDCGYFYPGFDCEEGGLAVLQAFSQHDADLANYREKARAFLHTLDPENGDNVRAYNEALVNLYRAGPL
ncbi:DUF2827 domain-containing protein [Polaromonas sp. YR568]|uniref:DUF2827 domain-containing protein n=1 Tax=Polaromonas sp. YR568 TaxID=1855301 RepID=UPI00398BE6C7